MVPPRFFLVATARDHSRPLPQYSPLSPVAVLSFGQIMAVRGEFDNTESYNYDPSAGIVPPQCMIVTAALELGDPAPEYTFIDVVRGVFKDYGGVERLIRDRQAPRRKEERENEIEECPTKPAEYRCMMLWCWQ